MSKKYELVKTDTVKSWDGRTLYRIKALREIVSLGIAVGALGGYIEKEDNLAQVSGDARVYDDAWVYGNAQVYGDARVSGNAWVYGDARVSGKILVASRSDGYTFLVTPTPEGPRIIAGCRYFTFKEAKAHWKSTRGGTKLGDESLLIVKHLEGMAKLNGFMEPVV